jgi:hypothetical protein
LLLLLAGAGREIVEARLEAEIPEGRDVAVHLIYRLAGTGAFTLPVSALESGGVQIEGLPASLSIPEEASEIELGYLVRGGAVRDGERLRVHLPCALVDLPIDETKGALFSSRIRLPEGFTVHESFPAQSFAFEGGLGFELPIVPRFVALRASSKPVLLSAPRVSTAVVVLLLCGVGLFGIRRMKDVSR